MSNLVSLAFYSAVFFVLFMLSLPSYGNNPKRKRFFVCFFSVILLTLVAGLRGLDVGNDTPQYVAVYADLATSRFPFPNIRFEKGFTMFMYLCYKISSNPRVLIFLSSLVMNLLLGIFVFHNVKNEREAILLYCFAAYLGNLSAMRQGMGVAILLIFLPALFKKKYVLYLFGVFLAGLFHKICFIGALLIFAPLIKDAKKCTIWFVALSLIMAVIGQPLIVFIISKTPFYYYIGTEFFQSATMGGLFNMMLPTFALIFTYPLLNRLAVITTKSHYLADGSVLLSYDDGIKGGQYLYFEDREMESLAGPILSNNQGVLENEMKHQVFVWSLLLSECMAIFSIPFAIFSRVYVVYLLPFLLVLPDEFEKSENAKIKTFLILALAFMLMLVQGVLRPYWIGVYNYHF